MALIVSLLAEATKDLSERFIDSVREALARVVLPEKIDGGVVERYIRKAMRAGVWRLLKPEARALLLALRKWGLIRSQTLRSILHMILLEIELHTLRGRALFYGILLSVKSFGHGLSEALRNVSRLLYLGISYLNNPPMYRVYG